MTPARGSTSALVPLPSRNSTSTDSEHAPGDVWIVIDNEDVVVGGKLTGERETNLPAADDDDAHRYALANHSN